MEKAIKAEWYIDTPFFGKTKCTANFSTVKEAEADMQLNGISRYIIYSNGIKAKEVSLSYFTFRCKKMRDTFKVKAETLEDAYRIARDYNGKFGVELVSAGK